MLKIFALVAALVAAADQAAKAWIMVRLIENQFIEVVPGLFNIVHFRNRGAAFGILNDGGAAKTAFLLVVTIVAIVVIATMVRKSTSYLYTAALSLIAGGAVGNLIDRFRFGSVVDFLDLHYAGHHWPAFNVADSAITVGVVVALISHYMLGKTGPEESIH